ncbi:transposase [Chryseobacterium sp. HMWF035]|uniref:transposase n=1 Tax=Chryseobacterium sp. HMWF035 TaxID=2056868 RepID=UPI000D58114E|nr:transposase [Chryseobacterium sp. HMWF035]PVV55080.1 transposase [Chryseobacterium sp. HMWF035]
MSKFNFKEIHIGELIKKRILELGYEKDRILKFHKISEDDLKNMLLSESLDSSLILRWSKLLEYDFFRIYSHHLILYSPQSSINLNDQKKNTVLPVFRKNIYTKEIIDFLIELLKTGQKTKNEIINDYNIPKTTLYKWIDKYGK